MDEVWKDIDDFEGYYQISNFGRIRSCDRYVNSKSGSKRLVRGNIHNCYVGHGGYYYISLYKDNKHRLCTLHRLIAKAFLPNPNDLPCIDHINTDRKDNRIDNLKWVSYLENNKNEITIKHKKESMNLYRVEQLSEDKEVIAEYISTREASEKTGFLPKSIQVAISRKHKLHGFYWRYKS